MEPEERAAAGADYIGDDDELGGAQDEQEEDAEEAKEYGEQEDAP